VRSIEGRRRRDDTLSILVHSIRLFRLAFRLFFLFSLVFRWLFFLLLGSVLVCLFLLFFIIDTLVTLFFFRTCLFFYVFYSDLLLGWSFFRFILLRVTFLPSQASFLGGTIVFLIVVRTRVSIRRRHSIRRIMRGVVHVMRVSIIRTVILFRTALYRTFLGATLRFTTNRRCRWMRRIGSSRSRIRVYMRRWRMPPARVFVAVVRWWRRRMAICMMMIRRPTMSSSFF
jgi:hypothetical protein